MSCMRASKFLSVKWGCLPLRINWDHECDSLELSKCKHLVFIHSATILTIAARKMQFRLSQFKLDLTGNFTQRTFLALLLFLPLCQGSQYIYITLDSSCEFWLKHEMWLPRVVPFLSPEKKKKFMRHSRATGVSPDGPERTLQQPTL